MARYGTEPGADEAEIAVVVQDAWQGRGLGTILLSALLDHAVSRGITKFLAYVLADNHRMLRLVGRQGVVIERSHDQGVVSSLHPPMTDFVAARRRMVDTQLVSRGIRHPGVLRAMASVPRERFVPGLDAPDAYADSAMPIGQGQTISQPYVVALMIEALAPESAHRVSRSARARGTPPPCWPSW